MFLKMLLQVMQQGIGMIKIFLGVSHLSCYLVLFLLLVCAIRHVSAIPYFGNGEKFLFRIRPPFKSRNITLLRIAALLLPLLSSSLYVLESDGVEGYSIASALSVFAGLFLKNYLVAMGMSLWAQHRYKKFLSQYGEIPASAYEEAKAKHKKEGAINTVVPFILVGLPYVLLIVIIVLIILAFK